MNTEASKTKIKKSSNLLILTRKYIKYSYRKQVRKKINYTLILAKFGVNAMKITYNLSRLTIKI